MKNLILLLVLSLGIQVQSQAQFKDLLNKTKSILKDDVGLGLKDALNIGVQAAVDSLSAKNGFLNSPYKILMPAEARTVAQKLQIVPGFQDLETKLTSKMNEAAEIAAKKATPIFISAIKQMTFEDAKNILMGNDDAATRYLEKTTRDQLYTEFMPIIQAALDEVDARTYWKSAISKYNKLPLVKKVNPDLDDHVNNGALNGMFGFIQVKEAGIRNDVSQRTSPRLKEVFSRQDK